MTAFWHRRDEPEKYKKRGPKLKENSYKTHFRQKKTAFWY